MQVTDTAAIVTGGASGLGAAAASALAERGVSVFVFDLLDAIEAAPRVDGVTFVPVDVTDPVQVQAGVDRASESAQPLRIAVNCAGIGPSMRILGRTGPHDLGLYAKVVQVNLIGTFNVMTLAAEKMASTPALGDGQRGVIVNTASVAAYDGQVGQAAYASSKGGVVGLTLPAARDLGQHGIRVLTIAPGIMETPMLETVSEEVQAGLAAGIPFPRRLGRPQEFAQLTMSLIENDYLNGETIRLDGSLRMAPR